MIAAYVRVSTVGQHAGGQRAAIERWLEGNGYDPASVTWFEDSKSGDDLNRPAFKAMQAAIFNGEVSTVVCFKLDRLSRSLRDGINTLGDWLDKGIRVVATSQQLDFSGATGQLVASTLFAVAQLEQETRRERQAVGIEQAKKAGKYQGRKAGSTKAKPARARALREQGLQIAEIATAMSVSQRTVIRYLSAA